jgi:hypothetical protein
LLGLFWILPPHFPTGLAMNECKKVKYEIPIHLAKMAGSGKKDVKE